MKNAECRRQNVEWVTRHSRSRFTHHAPRTTHHAPRSARAFTLVELLVVMAVIGLLAALTFPAVQGARIAMLRARAKSELMQLETAIERYKDKLGHYPPDCRLGGNPDPYAVNQLYYELLGTTNVSTPPARPFYVTLDGSARIDGDSLPAIFGANVAGFMNCARTGGDDAVNAVSFLKGLKPSQFLATTINSKDCTVLGSALEGPLTYQSAAGAKINPWRYNASNPTNNVKTFDLWIDVTVGSKTNRICNWHEKPLVISTPYQ